MLPMGWVVADGGGVVVRSYGEPQGHIPVSRAWSSRATWSTEKSGDDVG